MKTFNFHRFIRTLKWTLRQERAFILRIFATMILTNLAILMFFLYGAVHISKDIHADISCLYLYLATFICLAFYQLFLSIGSSLMFRNMNDTQGRISFLMNPASNFEKFLVRWIEVVVIGTILFFVAFLIADLIRMVLLPLCTGVHWGPALLGYIDYDPVMKSSYVHSLTPISASPGFSSGMEFGKLLRSDIAGEGAWLTPNLWMGTIYLQSFYMLCATFFRRHAWLFAIIISSIISSIINKVVTGPVEFSLDMVLIIFNYIAAYRLFKRHQVISNKWINL